MISPIKRRLGLLLPSIGLAAFLFCETFPALEAQSYSETRSAGTGDFRSGSRFQRAADSMRGTVDAPAEGGEGGGWRRRGGAGRFGRRERASERASYAPLELRGIIGKGRNALVSITEVQTGESHWVGLRDSSARWYVSEVNHKKRTANVLFDGMPITISLITLGSSGTPSANRPMFAVNTNVAVTNYLPVGANSAVGDSAAPPQTEFNARAIVEEFAPNPNKRPTFEQMTAFRERLATLSPEQRSEVFAQIRQVHRAATAGGSDSAGGAGAGTGIGGAGIGANASSPTPAGSSFHGSGNSAPTSGGNPPPAHAAPATANPHSAPIPE